MRPPDGDRPERLSDLRELQRRVAGHRHHPRKLMTSTAGICALIDNFFPVVHVARMRRGAPTPLEKLRYGCWELGFQAGVEVDERRDFQCVLYRWARRPGRRLGDELPESDELAEAVVQRLRPSRFWKLMLGFVPIVGPIAAYRLDVGLMIDGSMAARIYRLAHRYYAQRRSPIQIAR